MSFWPFPKQILCIIETRNARLVKLNLSELSLTHFPDLAFQIISLSTEKTIIVLNDHAISIFNIFGKLFLVMTQLSLQLFLRARLHSRDKASQRLRVSQDQNYIRKFKSNKVQFSATKNIKNQPVLESEVQDQAF